jgi:type I restriction enzyme S subunit
MKRYERYRDSKYDWLGQVPMHWEELYLSQCGYEQCISNKEVHHHNLLSLSYGQIIRKDINKTDGLLPNSFDTYQIVNEGDIVLRLTDLQNDKKSLRTGLAKETGIVTSAYLTIHSFKHIIPEFLYYVLHTYDVQKVFYGLGGGLRQNCSFRELRKLLIYTPSMKEQEQIVHFLDGRLALIDKYVKEKEREVELIGECFKY